VSVSPSLSYALAKLANGKETKHEAAGVSWLRGTKKYAAVGVEPTVNYKNHNSKNGPSTTHTLMVID
jgi:hypothetical protein